MEPKLLYHYTSMETFSTMLEKSLWSAKGDSLCPTHIVMWATHCNFLNDKTEYRLFVKGLKYQVGEYAKEQGTVLNAEQFKILDNAVKYNDTFIISLSEKEDDLNMWRGYAKDGEGVALGFDFTTIQPPLMHPVSDNNVSIETKYENEHKGEFDTIINYREKPEKCHYVYPTPKEMAIDNSLVKNVYELLIKKEADNFNDVLLIRKTHFFSPLYKHYKYCNEGEWRIVINDMIHIKYRQASGQLIPYREVRIPIECLKKIIVGPCLEAEVIANRLETLAKYRLIHKIEIEISSIPYRNRL